ncbi:DUF6285 domain-containing protein [Spongiibacter marinus]|uniref:DUF6285 domain-containing protein n=1 Tax=Spongiibacter marinus TaxID=354246 RepID=UPI00041C049C|nr:DUF6285 domain-containing protein [Spongiibacter marinus]
MAIEHPNAEQLLEAVSEFLKQSILPAVDAPALSYQLRVAINGLGIVGRELSAGGNQQRGEQALLAEFLGQRGELVTLREQLRSHIEGSDAPYRDPALLEMLQKISDAKLAIDNPKYQPVRLSSAGIR